MFFIPRRIAFFSTFALVILAPVVQAQASHERAPRVEGIRFWSFGDVTRVAIETSGDYHLYSEQIEKPNRVFFDLNGLQPPDAARHAMETIPVDDHRIRQIRVARLSGDKTRIVFDLDCPVEVISSQLVNPDRLMIEIRPKDTSLPALSVSRSVTGSRKVDLSAHTTAVDRDIAEAVPAALAPAALKDMPRNSRPAEPRVVKENSRKDNPVKDDADDAYHPPRPRPESTVARASEPPPLTAVTVNPPAPANAQTPIKSTASNANDIAANDIAAARMDSAGDRSLVRLFGLKLGRVVIDAGHGGHDSGTIGPNGLMEKDLVLDVAMRLGALITRQMGAEVIYTRSTDVFIPLEERTKIANDQKADLFISVHANSSPEPSASGVETYYFNLTSDKNGLDLATRENATADSSISDLNDLLHRAVLQTKREESREFAQKVQASLSAASRKSNGPVRDRGVRQAPFVVLIGATMPSILAEIGFVSNPRDERLLRRSDQREKIAEALFKGVLQYANSLSHMQMARAGEE
jgi:N-acetylmuramoyl-L-alanine amidase